MIPRKSLQIFKEIFRKELGIELSDREAEGEALELLNFYKAIFGDPLSVINKNKNYEKTKK